MSRSTDSRSTDRRPRSTWLSHDSERPTRPASAAWLTPRRRRYAAIRSPIDPSAIQQGSHRPPTPRLVGSLCIAGLTSMRIKGAAPPRRPAWTMGKEQLEVADPELGTATLARSLRQTRARVMARARRSAMTCGHPGVTPERFLALDPGSLRWPRETLKTGAGYAAGSRLGSCHVPSWISCRGRYRRTRVFHSLAVGIALGVPSG